MGTRHLTKPAADLLSMLHSFGGATLIVHGGVRAADGRVVNSYGDRGWKAALLLIGTELAKREADSMRHAYDSPSPGLTEWHCDIRLRLTQAGMAAARPRLGPTNPEQGP